MASIVGHVASSSSTPQAAPISYVTSLLYTLPLGHRLGVGGMWIRIAICKQFSKCLGRHIIITVEVMIQLVYNQDQVISIMIFFDLKYDMPHKKYNFRDNGHRVQSPVYS